MRLLSVAILSVALVTGCAGAAAPTASTVDIGVGLRGPAGLVATTYATGLANVAAVAVDDDDRLWAATASFADDGSDAVYLVPAAAVSAPCGACDPTTEDAAAVVSVLPDGTDLRVVASRIRAPVGLAFLPSSDDLFVTMNQRDDLGEATPGDWLAVVRDGQDWGFPGCYGQGGTVCHGTPAPVAELDSMPPSAGWRS